MDEDLSRYRDLFLSEAQEKLQALNETLLALEKEPANLELVQVAFRLVHTLKGMAATMGYQAVVALAHSAEGLLDRVRRGGMAITPELTNRLFAAADALEELVAAAGGLEAGAVPARTLGHAQLSPPGDLPPAAEARPGRAPWPPEGFQKEPDPLATLPASVRVKAAYLDYLLQLVGDLTLSSNRLTALLPALDHLLAKEAITEEAQIVGELREAVLRARTLPVAQVFHRFPRMVRDLAQQQGKQVDFRQQGLEMELDRAMLEQIGDALVHLLRNAIDHGLETPAERLRLGKPPRGLLRLSARREKGYALITVEDDGRGLDPQEVLAQAAALGIRPNPPRELGQEELLELICHPRFSTAGQITSVSGRGVGLDAVKRRLEALGGTLMLHSVPSRGTKFSLRLPLTLAIIPVLLVGVGEETYALPVASISGTGEVFADRLEWEDGGAYAWVGGERLLVLWLRELLAVPGSDAGGPRWPAALVEVGERRVALAADRLWRTEEVVVNPPPGLVRGLRGLAGVTVVGDGRVVLILDPVGLVAQK